MNVGFQGRLRGRPREAEGALAEGAIALADAIKNNGAMAKFTFSGQVDDEQGPPITMETSMLEADFGDKKLGISGAMMLAAFLPKCQ